MIRRTTHVRVQTLGLLLLLAVFWTVSAPRVAVADNKVKPVAVPQSVATPKSVAELKALEAKVRSVVAKVTACTVGVRIGSKNGSGVIVSEDGLVMTAGHVVGKPGQDVTFLMPDGKQVKGKTLGVFKTADAGLMKITEKGKWPFAKKGRPTDLKVGAWCIAVGHPLGYQEKRPPVVRVGRVLRITKDVVQTDCPLVGGDSGGPLFDLDGKVIGINSRIGGSVLQNFHVPVGVYIEYWDRLVKGEAWETKLPSRNGDDMKATLRGLVSSAGKCIVRVLCNGKEVAMGTVVGPDGWILTKASELKGKVVCRMNDKRELEAQVVGVDLRFDLAMLKVKATDLPRINWNLSKQAVGQLVVAPGPDGLPLAMGVVSVPRRPIPLTSGALGILVKDGKNGAEIDKVLPKSPAEKAGLKVKDLITAVNGKPTPNRNELVALVKRFPPGAAVTMKVMRGAKELEVKAKLGKLQTPGTRRRDMQNALGVGVSKRRDAFPIVLQHDIALPPVDCGGPLVDLTGNVVGVNIARGGRTETYCVPSDVLIMLMYDLMSGRLSPSILAKAKARAAAAKAAAEKAAAEKKKAETQAKKKAEEDAAAKKKAKDKLDAEKAAAEKKKAETQAKKKADEEAAAMKNAKEKAAAAKAATEKAAAEKKQAEAQAKKKADEEAAAKKNAKEKAAAKKS